MPIEVQHGGVGAGTTAGQIIAQAGQSALARQQQDRQLTQQLSQQRDMQMREIDARADLQRQSADEASARTAMEFGLEGEVREQEFDRELSRMHEEAKLQAQQVDYAYTSKQRQDFAKFNNARQAINDSKVLNEKQRTEALRQVDLAQAGIVPSMRPADPDKFTWPEIPDRAGNMQQTGLGVTWEDSFGNVVTGTMSADGPSAKLILRWDQSEKHQQAQIKASLETEERKITAGAAAAEAKRKSDFLDSLYEQTVTAKDIGAGTESERPLSVKEIRERYNARFPGEQQVDPVGMTPADEAAEVRRVLAEKYGYPAGQAGEAQTAQPAGQPGEQPTGDWVTAIEQGTGLRVSDSNRALGSVVGPASVIYEAIQKKYGPGNVYDKIPDNLKPQYREVVNVLEEHYGGE